MTTFGSRLRHATEQHGLTPSGLARAMETDRAHVCHLMSDDKTPRLDTLERILEAMPNLDARWLILGRK